MIKFKVFLFFGLLHPFNWVLAMAIAPPPHSSLAKDRIVLPSRMLQPGQPSVGMKQVLINLTRFIRKNIAPEFILPPDPLTSDSIDDLRRFLSPHQKLIWEKHREKPLQGILLPDNQVDDWNVLIVDGHHKWVLFHLLGVELFEVNLIPNEHLIILEREEKLWKTLQEKNHIHLLDKNHSEIFPHQLPTSLHLLDDDPFRTLAWLLKKIGIITKENKELNFQEFIWARYLRNEFIKRTYSLDFFSDSEFVLALKRAIDILYLLTPDQIAELYLPSQPSFPLPERIPIPLETTEFAQMESIGDQVLAMSDCEKTLRKLLPDH